MAPQGDDRGLRRPRAAVSVAFHLAAALTPGLR
jgi:hypothetical protein